MSTKIYNGMKIDTGNLFYLHEIIDEINKESYHIMFNELIPKHFSYLFAWCYDLGLDSSGVIESLKDSWVEDNDSKLIKLKNYSVKNTLWMILLDMMEFNQKKICESHRRNPPYDFMLELFIYPLYDDKILINPRYEQDEYGNILKKHFEDYSYWNNTDKPDVISEDDWKRRHDEWNQVVGIKKNKLYKWQNFYPENYPVNYFSVDDMKKFFNNALKYIPSVKQRAKELVFREQVKLRCMDLTSKKTIFSEYMKIDNEVKNDVKNGVFDNDIDLKISMIKVIDENVIRNHKV